MEGRQGRQWKFFIYGAGGYSGTLVCKRIAHDLKVPPGQWAISGRSEGALLRLRRELGSQYDSLAIVVADATKESLKGVVAKSHVVINCAGPFAICGDAVVSSCIETNTQYCDISGEPSFLRAMASAYHDDAVVARVKIVPCCGFDCVPADIGVQQVVSLCEHAVVEVDNYVTIKSGMSSGTMQTALQSISDSVAKPAARSGSLPKGEKCVVGRRKPRQWPHYLRVAKGWALPFPVADPHVVLRSMSMQDRSFAYRHWLVVPSFFQVVKLIIGGMIIVLLMKFNAGHTFVHNRLPSRQGPKQDELDAGSASMLFVAHSEGNERVLLTLDTTHVYLATAAAVVEAARCLYEGIGPIGGGVLTPATAFGEAFRNRLLETKHYRF
jgi:short subunit dehydrogenase-like uncharacterized protein